MFEIKTNYFSKNEYNYIMSIARDFIANKKITGVNLIQSENSLPQSAVIVHFLHDSKEHLDYFVKNINANYEILPRYTYYLSKPEYFKKPEFKGEYKKAIFLNSYFEIIPIEEAIAKPLGVTIVNNELDLIIPVKKPSNLTNLIDIIREGNENGPFPWLDPVLIVKTEEVLKLKYNLNNTYFLSISREKEEFYTIINNKNMQMEIANFLENECKISCVGNLIVSDIVFKPSYVNKEFYKFIEDNL